MHVLRPRWTGGDGVPVVGDAQEGHVVLEVLHAALEVGELGGPERHGLLHFVACLDQPKGQQTGHCAPQAVPRQTDGLGLVQSGVQVVPRLLVGVHKAHVPAQIQVPDVGQVVLQVIFDVREVLCTPDGHPLDPVPALFDEHCHVMQGQIDVLPAAGVAVEDPDRGREVAALHLVSCVVDRPASLCMLHHPLKVHCRTSIFTPLDQLCGDSAFAAPALRATPPP
mmetsp:Transcript_115201/g.200523  ORF Transcript_115201/g.200523 Transcript_115201/m.200523 type:complete len:224 (+) Transcript_115201:1316-1987(+)